MKTFDKTTLRAIEGAEVFVSFAGSVLMCGRSTQKYSRVNAPPVCSAIHYTPQYEVQSTFMTSRRPYLTTDIYAKVGTASEDAAMAQKPREYCCGVSRGLASCVRPVFMGPAGNKPLLNLSLFPRTLTPRLFSVLDELSEEDKDMIQRPERL